MNGKRRKIGSIRDDERGDVTVCGWLRTARKAKGFVFLEVNDGSVMHNLQVIFSEGTKGYEALLPKLTVGASVRCRGKVVESLGSGQAIEMQASSLELLGECPADSYPLQKKGHTFEFLRTIAHLRCRTNTMGAVMRIRSALSFATHQFFQGRGFLYLHTPIITGSDCEGGGEQFLVSTINPNDPPRDEKGAVDFKRDFFGKKAYLTVSGQLNGEAAACGLSEIYTFGPTFRAENSNTTRHLAEFWMIEPEVAFADLAEIADLSESYVQYTIRYVLDNCREDLEFLDKRIEHGLLARLEATVAQPFARVTYTEAIEILEESGEKFEYPYTWGSDLQTEHERYLAEKHFKKPVILYNYPRAIKAFYMRDNEDGKTVAAMDLLVPKIGELIGGSQREEREAQLRQKIIDFDLPVDDYSWYLELRKFGTVPHAGFGLGFERLVLFATGMENIRDVIPFPRTPGHVEF